VFCWPPPDAHSATRVEADPRPSASGAPGDRQGSAPRGDGATGIARKEDLAELTRLYGIEAVCFAFPAGTNRESFASWPPETGSDLIILRLLGRQQVGLGCGRHVSPGWRCRERAPVR
jgi:hypothetical protein